jgi:uncharacterized protein (UPF0548 family)
VPITLRRPTASQLEQLRRRLTDQPVTYRDVGASADRTLPSGYRHDRRALALGSGVEAWQAAKSALTDWKAHENAGVTVTPPRAPLTTGTTVTAATQVGPLWVIAPCRIVYTTDTPERFGFAYGTLPGHPEDGEEAFHVVREADETVRFEIVAFSRPASLLVRMGGPLSRAVQQRATGRYLEGLRCEVAAKGRR